jgi:hypothetical protein
VQRLTISRRDHPKRTTTRRVDTSVNADAHEDDDNQPADRNPVKLPLSDDAIEFAETQAELSLVEWAGLFDKGYENLIDCIFTEENLECVSATEYHIEWRKVLRPLLMNIPRPILQAALDGSLARMIAESDKVIYHYFTRVDGVQEED